MAKKKKQKERKPKPEPEPKPVPPKPKPKPKPRPMRKQLHMSAGCILAATLLAAGFANREAFENWCVQTTQVSTGAATWCARLDGQQEGLGTLTTMRYLSCAYDAISGAMMRAVTSEVASTGFRILGARFAKQAIMGVKDGRFVEDGPLLIETAEIWSWLYPRLQFPFSTATLIEMARNFALGEPDLLTQLDLDRIACPNCNWGWETVWCLLNGLIKGQLDKISGMAHSGALQNALTALTLVIACLRLLKDVKVILEGAKRAEALAKVSGSPEATAAHEEGLQEVRALVRRARPEVRSALKVESWQLQSADVVLKLVGRLNRDTVTVIESRAAEVRLVLTGTDDASFIRSASEMMIGKGGGVGKGDACVHVGGGPYVEGVRKSYNLELAVNSYDGEKEGLRVINRDRVAMFDALETGPLEVVVRPAACTASRAIRGVGLLCSPANRHGLLRFFLSVDDVIKTPSIVVDRPELNSSLAQAMVISRLAVMADLGRLVTGVPPLDELGLDEFSIQLLVRQFCTTSGHDEALLASSALEAWWRPEGSSGPFTFVSRGADSTVFARYPVLANPCDLAAAPSVEDGVFVCDASVDELWRNERARAREVHVDEKTSLQWARTDDDRKDWTRSALLEADEGDVAPFIYFDTGLGTYRSVRVAVVMPSSGSGGRKQSLMHDDDRFSDNINKLCRAGAVVVGDSGRDLSDVVLVSGAFDLRVNIRCNELSRLQEQGLVVLWEPFVNEALETSTPVFGEDEASVALRKKHAIFWRAPCGANFKRNNGKDPEVVEGIPRVPLGSANSFRVHPDVLEASDRRAAARLDASRGSGRRRRGR